MPVQLAYLFYTRRAQKQPIVQTRTHHKHKDPRSDHTDPTLVGLARRVELWHKEREARKVQSQTHKWESKEEEVTPTKCVDSVNRRDGE